MVSFRQVNPKDAEDTDDPGVAFKDVKPTDIPKGPGSFDVSDSGAVTFQPNRPPAKFTRKPFQVEDIGHMHARTLLNGGSANWSEMGCFKTTTGLWLAEELEAKRILIITTKTGKVTFFQTVPYLLPDHKLINVESTSRHPFVPERAVVLAHYNLFQDRSKIRKLLQDASWDLVLIDEAHRIKNRNAQWTKNIKKIKSKYRHIMTGTGFVNKPDEIWSLLHYLYPKNFSSYWRFRGHFCSLESGVGAGGQQYTTVTGIKPDAEEEFRELVRKVGVRRTKVELFDQLPSLMPPTKVWVTLNATQRKMYDSLVKELYMLDQQGVPISAPVVLAMLTRLRQVTVATPQVEGEWFDEKMDRVMQRITLVEPSTKLDALMELLEGTSLPSVVFTQFAVMAKLVVARFAKAKLRSANYSERAGKLAGDFIWMKAADDDATRAAKVQAFQTGNVAVFLSTISLGSESITLTAADKVIFLDRSWSPASNNQAIARVHRPGQTRPVQDIHIEAVDTVDQYVEEKLKAKQGWFNQIFGADNKDEQR